MIVRPAFLDRGNPIRETELIASACGGGAETAFLEGRGE
jgi:hypothetical protein